MPTDPEDNIGEQYPALPIDDDRNKLPALIAAIVSGGDVTGYLPLKTIDNTDGTASLVVDIGSGSVAIIPDPVGLKDIGGATIDPATEQKQDAIITAIGAISSADPVGLKNIALATINPSTEDTLATRASEATAAAIAASVASIDTDIDTSLSSRASEATLALLEAKDFATETTLALLEAKDFATETTQALLATEVTLAAIKTQTDKLTFVVDELKVTDAGAGGGGVDPVGLKNIALATIDPATEQKQDSIITQLATEVRGLFTSVGDAITSTLIGGKRSLDVFIANDEAFPVIIQEGEGNLAALGKMYVFASDQTNFTPSGTEHPFIFIRNPGGSGKQIRIRSVTQSIVSTNKPTTFRAYFNPTVTANGTVETPVNKLSDSVIATVALLTTLPTISANGVRVNADVPVAGVFVVEPGFTMIIAPGDSFLITVQPTVNNTLVNVTMDWAEVTP